MISFIRLVFTFYSTYSISSIAISLLSAGIFWMSGISFFVSLWLVLSPTNDMIVLGTENTDHRGIGTTTEERAEPAYNKQVLISKT